MIPLKALRRNLFKSFLVFSSITISVMAIFLITSLSSGLIDMYSRMLKSDGDIIITQKAIADTFFSNVDKQLMQQCEQLENVRSAYAMIVGASPVGTIPIAGVYGVSDKHFTHYTLLKGAYPKEGEVLLGSTLANQLSDETLKIGSQHFRVSGIYESEIGFEEGGVVMGLEDAGKLFSRSASFIVVAATSPDKTEALIPKILELDNDIDVKTTQNFVEEYNQFKIIEKSSYVISFLAFFMGLMGIASVMSMIVNARKEEFGIMRALGKSRLFIVKNLFLETLIMSLFAYGVAFLLSSTILEILPHIKMLQGYISGQISFDIALFVLVSTLGMALVGSLFPAWVASKTDPVLLINQGCS